MEITTIQLDKNIAKMLQESKEYPRQTYNELIKKMIESFKVLREKNQYDQFIHNVQQQKMKELWDNEKDEDWGKL